MGATASGKTDLALKLSSHLPIEIISVDSTSIYYDLDIGSAKPTKLERNICPHHLIDIKSPLESYSVAEFLQDSIELVSDINSRSKLPVFVGGTMMYYNALINGIHELPSSEELRIKLMKDCSVYGLDYIYDQLKKLDPTSAFNTNKNDKQRILRKLEICLLLNAPMSDVLQKQEVTKLANCDILSFALMSENREDLYKKSELRFDKMLERGIVDEVRHLLVKYPDLNLSHNSIRSVGYKQVWQFLNNEIIYEEMIEKAKTATRNLVKRQYTWLRELADKKITSASIDVILNDIEDFFTI